MDLNIKLPIRSSRTLAVTEFIVSTEFNRKVLFENMKTTKSHDKVMIK